MSRTITALFDSRSDAEAGQARLVAADIDASNIRVHEGSTDTAGSSSMSSSTMSSGSTGSYGSTSTTGTADGDIGIWSSIKNAFLPDEDRAAYEEGIRRGGFVLSADVDEDEVARAIEALEHSNSVDIDERADTWRSEGWNAAAAPASRPAMFGSETDRTVNPVMGDDDVIPVIEEATGNTLAGLATKPSATSSRASAA